MLFAALPPSEAARMLRDAEASGLQPPRRCFDEVLVRLADTSMSEANHFLQTFLEWPPTRLACRTLLRAACSEPDPLAAAQPVLDVLRAQGLHWKVLREA